MKNHSFLKTNGKSNDLRSLERTLKNDRFLLNELILKKKWKKLSFFIKRFFLNELKKH